MDRFTIYCIDFVHQTYQPQLTELDGSINDSNDTCNSVCEWLKVFFTHPAGQYPNAWFQDIDSVLSAVVQFPETWTASLLDTYLKTFPNEELNDRIVKLTGHLSQNHKTGGEGSGQSATADDVEMGLDQFKQQLQDSHGQLPSADSSANSWSLESNWSPRPIGIL